MSIVNCFVITDYCKVIEHPKCLYRFQTVGKAANLTVFTSCVARVWETVGALYQPWKHLLFRRGKFIKRGLLPSQLPTIHAFYLLKGVLVTSLTKLKRDRVVKIQFHRHSSLRTFGIDLQQTLHHLVRQFQSQVRIFFFIL